MLNRQFLSGKHILLRIRPKGTSEFTRSTQKVKSVFGVLAI